MNKAPEFSEFHDAYGRAYGEKIDRIAAERAWRRLSARDKRAAIAGIKTYADDCRQRGIAMKYPSGYLNLHRWEIEEVGSGTERELFPAGAPLPSARPSGTLATERDARRGGAGVGSQPESPDDPDDPLEGMETW